MPEFARKFFDEQEIFTFIGNGKLGGKAQGLVDIQAILKKNFNTKAYSDFSISIPRMTVISTDLFDSFMQLNKLYDIAYGEEADDRIAHTFQKASLPVPLVGDLYALISKVKSPLAIRSSSLLEDTLYEPFAGVYETKMTPNNQINKEERFHKLTEAIKYVYASTFFKNAKNYFKAIEKNIVEEKMAVIIQEVVGNRNNDRFYPDISGVARSYNYYATGQTKPKDGVVSLALGLGKIIVDEGISWNFSPKFPKIYPPYNTIDELLMNTQTSFWAVNMGKIPVYDPVKETEYLVKSDLKDAEMDGTLSFLSSTYDPQADKIYPGLINNGIKLINFAPILQLNQIPLVEIVKRLLDISEKVLNCSVEIEFALTINPKTGIPARLGFLQVRPMLVSKEKIEIGFSEMRDTNVLIASENALGNGYSKIITDVVYVKPDKFDTRATNKIASEIEQINQNLIKLKRLYLLIGFGRWGSSDPWLGIPTSWSQVGGAKVIVESTLPEINVDLSQGTHFFHNLINFRVSYFSIRHTSKYHIDWEWLEKQDKVTETFYVKHIKLKNPLEVKVDGRTGRGVILK